MGKLLEPQIKAILINKLIESGKIDSNSIVINEFTIDGSSRRVDLALVSKNHFEAFEIKSEADSLSRLEGQTSKYLEYFDKVTIISAGKHIKKIEQLFDKNIGLWVIKNSKLKIVKRGKKKKLGDRKKIISLMTANELKSLTRNLNIKTTSHKRKDLESALLHTPIYVLRSAALNSIKQRYDPNYFIFSKKTLGRVVHADDLKLLSSKRKEEIVAGDEPSIKSLISSIDAIPLTP